MIKTSKIQLNDDTIGKINNSVSLDPRDNEKITSAISQMPGIVDCSVNTAVVPNVINVSYRQNGTPLREIIEKVKELGYTQAAFLPNKEENNISMILQKEVKRYRNKFLWSLIIELPILVLMWIIPYTNPSFLTAHILFNGMPLYIFILLVLSSIIQFWMGASFYKGAYKAMRGCSANMDVLVVLGTTAAWAYGFLLIFIGDHAYGTSHKETMDDHMRHAVHEHGHNFEIAATLIVVILFGKFLESVTKKQTVDKLSKLASLKVQKAILMKPGANLGDINRDPLKLSDNGEEIDIELLVIGDVIKVINGQTIPIDGVVVQGEGQVNESMLTGEAKPVNKEISSKVFGGTMLNRGALLVKVDRMAESSAIN